MTRRKPYVSYKQDGKPCLSLCKKHGASLMLLM